MKRSWLSIGVTAAAVFTGVLLAERWRDENVDRRVAIVMDWAECRDLGAREGLSAADMFTQARAQGVSAVVLPALTLQDLLSQHRVTPKRTPFSDPLETYQLQFQDPFLAVQAERELRRRGGADVHLVPNPASAVMERGKGSFLTLKDVEIGFDPQMLSLLAEKELAPVLRINQDPWTTVAQARQMMDDDVFPEGASLLFNSDDPPGGPEALPFWTVYLRHHPRVLALFEIHFSRAAVQLAKALPALAFRAHTIPAPELKDLNEAQELNRWRRAIDERSCRILLVHTSPSDSWPGFLERIGRMRQDFQNARWVLARPRWRIFWKTPPALEAELAATLACFLAILLPWTSLRLGYDWIERRGSSSGWRILRIFFAMSATTVTGACLMAALAGTPQSRLEIVPFHGIKAAFLLGWAGCVYILYGWDEIRASLDENIRRWDVLFALFVIALVGYALIRSGNAAAVWKHPMEQGLRDHLETLFIGRPRFKEFALGHPLLLLGLYVRKQFRMDRFSWDGRPMIAIGMVGQVSLVNTFCHLHSPLRLIFMRSINGLVLGSMIGGAAIFVFGLWLEQRDV